MEFKGHNGQVRLLDDEIVISRKGALGFITQGFKGEKSISIDSISSVQFKNAGLLVNGYIQFAFIGGRETKAGIFDATRDENTVMFNYSQQSAFEKLRDSLKEKMRASKKPQTTYSQASLADEIEKLASLRDRGILTEEEFREKKRSLLI